MLENWNLKSGLIVFKSDTPFLLFSPSSLPSLNHLINQYLLMLCLIVAIILSIGDIMMNNLYPQVAQNFEEDTESKQTSRIYCVKGYSKRRKEFYGGESIKSSFQEEDISAKT